MTVKIYPKNKVEHSGNLRYYNKMKIALAAIMLFVTAACPGTSLRAENITDGRSRIMITLFSPAFKDGGKIPAKYTCKGENVSPQLSWPPPPQGTKSFAIVCNDPDAPSGNWLHWIIFNIPAASRGLEEGVPKASSLDDGSMQGMNDSKGLGYDGPCPPSGTHRYFFSIYALDSMLELEAGASLNQLNGAMKGHILAEGSLMGTFSR